MRTVFLDSVKTDSAFDDAFGYANPESASEWASATRSNKVLMLCVIALGGKVMGGKVVTCGVTP